MANIFTLSPGNVDYYEYLASEEILSQKKDRIIEGAKFIYSPLDKYLGNKQKLLRSGKETCWSFTVRIKKTELEKIEGAFQQN